MVEYFRISILSIFVLVKLTKLYLPKGGFSYYPPVMYKYFTESIALTIILNIKKVRKFSFYISFFYFLILSEKFPDKDAILFVFSEMFL